MATTSSQVVVTSIKARAVEWINSKCSCTRTWEEIKWAADTHVEETSKWCTRSRRTWDNTLQLSNHQWEPQAVWAWWARCQVVCHSWEEELLAWAPNFLPSQLLRETTQTFSHCMSAIFQIRHSTLTCWNSLTQRATNSQVWRWCSTLSPKDQKALVILTSILKRRQTDVWLKWIMQLLMTDALS